MFKTILFDLDDTILDFHKSERLSLEGMLSHFGITATDDILLRYSQINLSQWKRLEKGELNHNEVKLKRYEILFDEFNLNIPAQKATEIYENNLSKSACLIDGALDLIKELSSLYKLYIVSNGAYDVQMSRLEISGIKKYFDDIFISEKIGYDKPDKRFFDFCFSQIPDFKREETIIVGDSLSSDILGGINSGIKTCHLKRTSQSYLDIHPDYEISSIADLKKILIKA